MPSYAGTAHAIRSYAYDPATDALCAAMTSAPSTDRRLLIDGTVRRLKTSGLWDALEIFYVLAAHDAQAARLNWAAPTTYALTATNSPTFTADRGYTGNGSNTSLDSSYVPTINAVKYAQNSAAIFVWSLSNTRANNSIDVGFGSSTQPSGSKFAYINTWNGTVDNTSHAIHNANINAFSPGNASGFFVLSRTVSTDYGVYRNGVSYGTQSTASIGLPDQPFYGLTGNVGFGNFPTSRQIGLIGLSSGLSAAQVDAFYEIMRIYMVNIGAST